MNRFVKKNMILLLVLGSASVLVLFLLVLAVIQHSRMDEYMAKTDELRNQIRSLIEQTPAPVKGNELPLKENTKMYNKAADQLERYFGRPFAPAMDAFIKTLASGQPKPADPEEEYEPLTLEKFREDFFNGDKENPIENFPEGWKGIGAESFAQQQMYYRLFQRKYKKWNEAMQNFRALASQVTTEPLTDSSVNELFLSVLGVPRVMNFDPKKLKQYMEDYRLKLLDINSKLIVEAGAMSFSFGTGNETSSGSENMGRTSRFGGAAVSRFGGGGGGNSATGAAELPAFTKDEYPLIPFHMDVIGDIFNRICQTEVRVVENIKRRSFAGVEEGSFVRYDYSVEVIGPISEVRKLVHLLEEGYQQNRMYVVRSVFLYQQSDEAAAYITPGEVVSEEEANNGMNPMNAPATTGRRGRRQTMMQNSPDAGMMMSPDGMGMTESAQQRAERRRLAEIEREKSLEPTKRSSYGRLLVGAVKECRAVVDISYIVKPIPVI